MDVGRRSGNFPFSFGQSWPELSLGVNKAPAQLICNGRDHLVTFLLRFVCIYRCLVVYQNIVQLPGGLKNQYKEKLTVSR